jgi:hypothetical protein
MIETLPKNLKEEGSIQRIKAIKGLLHQLRNSKKSKETGASFGPAGIKMQHLSAELSQKSHGLIPGALQETEDRAPHEGKIEFENGHCEASTTLVKPEPQNRMREYPNLSQQMDRETAVAQAGVTEMESSSKLTASCLEKFTTARIWEGSQDYSQQEAAAPPEDALRTRILDAKGPCREHERPEDTSIELGFPVIPKQKKLLAFLLLAGVVLFGAILELWTPREPSLNSDRGASVLANEGISLVDRQAMARAFYEQGNLQETSRQCDLILEKDPQNRFALELREKIRSQEIQPARPRHDPSSQDALQHDIKASEPNPKRPSLGAAGSTPVLKNRVRERRPDFIYPVIHDHVLGSCRGSLRINNESIAFVASGNSKHGFTAKWEDIVGTELGEVLKIKLRNKTYRFKVSFAANKEDHQARLYAIHQQLTKSRAGL